MGSLKMRGFELKYRDSGNTIHFSFLTTQFFLPSQKITITKHNIKRKKNRFLNDNHRKKLCFTKFSTRTYWNKGLAASGLFYMLTQSSKFYKFHWHMLRKKIIHQIDREWRMVVPFSKFYGKIWVGLSLNTGKRFFLEVSF